MKIGLVSEFFVDGDVEFNANQIRKRSIEGSEMGLGLICFGESFLQGFEGLSWEYAEDLPRALSQDDEIINSLRKIASQHRIALSFGYMERAKGSIYCSNLVISQEGKIINNFRRLSPGWKEPTADGNYKEGGGFSIFTYGGKRFATAICGDLWSDENLNAVKQLQIDCLLWPNYVDYSTEKWESGEKEEYARRVRDMPFSVLMINSYAEQPNRAKGGCFVFWDGLILQELPMGKLGVLVYEL